MADEVWLIDDSPLRHDYFDEPKPAKRIQPQCLCGRFAKYVGDQYYYNGTWDCYRYTVLCSRCGKVDIECV